MNEETVVFTLSNGKKYALVEKLTIDNNEYLWLTNIEDINDTNIYRLNDNKLEKIIDENLIKKLMLEISTKNNLNN